MKDNITFTMIKPDAMENGHAVKFYYDNKV